MAAASSVETRWNCTEDIAKDLAKLDDFGADYGDYSQEVLTNRGRGSKKREGSPVPGGFFLDPRTGEKIDLYPNNGDEDEEDEYMKYANDEIKAELKSAKKESGYATGIGRGRPLQNTKDSEFQLKKQLRTVNSHLMSNDLIEKYVNKEAEKRSPKKTASPVLVSSSKKRTNPRYSSDSSSSSAPNEPNRLQTSSSKRDKVTSDPPPSFKAPERKRTNRNALIENLLQRMEKKMEEQFEDAPELSPLKKSDDSRSKILSDVLTDDDVVVGSEVGNDDDGDNDDDIDVFSMSFKPRKSSPVDRLLNVNPKSFKDVARESDHDILEFKNEFLKNFVEAKGDSDIGKNVVADLEKRKSPKNRTLVFTNRNLVGGANPIKSSINNNNITTTNNNNHMNQQEKVYERLAEKMMKEKNRKKTEVGGVYDLKLDSFFLSSEKKKAESSFGFAPIRAASSSGKSSTEKENEFSLFNTDFPSLS